MKLADMVRQWVKSGRPQPADAGPEPDPEPEAELTPSQWLEEEYRRWRRGELPSQQRRAGPLERASRGRW
jgi:hypothetical protein